MSDKADCRHGSFVFPQDTYIGKSLEKYGSNRATWWSMRERTSAR